MILNFNKKWSSIKLTLLYLGSLIVLFKEIISTGAPEDYKDIEFKLAFYIHCNGI